MALLRQFRRKFGIMLKALCIVIFLVILKAVLDYNGLALITLNTIITAFLGGVFFTIGIILAGAVADYKEAEKIPGDLASLLKSVYNDALLIQSKRAKKLQMKVKEVLYTINDNFRRNVWKLKEIDGKISAINDDLIALGKEGIAPNYLIKIRSELTNIDRIAHRVDTIIETSFIPAAHTIAEMAITIILGILLFVKSDNAYLGMVLFGVIALILLSLLFLIKDIDNPFETGKGMYADVDLSILFSLEKYWKGK